ncbi:hypothetical protein V8C86DRAFT_3027566, partial [Haematococcus lacustris]
MKENRAQALQAALQAGELWRAWSPPSFERHAGRPDSHGKWRATIRLVMPPGCPVGPGLSISLGRCLTDWGLLPAIAPDKTKSAPLPSSEVLPAQAAAHQLLQALAAVPDLACLATPAPPTPLASPSPRSKPLTPLTPGPHFGSHPGQEATQGLIPHTPTAPGPFKAADPRLLTGMPHTPPHPPHPTACPCLCPRLQHCCCLAACPSSIKPAWLHGGAWSWFGVWRGLGSRQQQPCPSPTPWCCMHARKHA